MTAPYEQSVRAPSIGEPLRVCIVAPLPPPYGGIAHWAAMIRDHAETVPGVQLRFVDTAPHWRGVHDLRRWRRVFGGSLQFCRDFLRFCVMLVSWRPHVVHLTTSGQLAVLRDLGIIFTAACFRRHVVYHIRFGRVPEIAQSMSLEWRVLKIAIRLSHVVIVLDEGTRCAVARYLATANVHQIPNCVRPFAVLPSSVSAGAPRTVLFLGWVIPTKGIDELLQAWQCLRPSGWRLLIAGPHSSAYRADLQRRYDLPTVEFCGELDHEDAMQALGQAELLVLPSHTEGFPNVVLEAMAAGKPVVATSVGAIPEMLGDDCGIVVPPRDAVALSKALSRMMTDNPLRTTCSTAALRKVEREYSLSAVFQRYVAIWRKASFNPARH